MKTTRLAVTLLLVSLMLIVPGHAQQTQPPAKHNVIIMGCLVLAIGAVFVYGVYKLCEKLPPMDPPGDQPPPPVVIVTNYFPVNTNLLTIIQHGSTTLQMPSRDLHQSPKWQVVTLALESSPDLTHWSPSFYVTNWICPTQHIYVVSDSKAVPVRTNWNPIKASTNDQFAYVDASGLLPVPDGPMVNYRMRALP
jgi:hypothetical protein